MRVSILAVCSSGVSGADVLLTQPPSSDALRQIGDPSGTGRPIAQHVEKRVGTVAVAAESDYPPSVRTLDERADVEVRRFSGNPFVTSRTSSWPTALPELEPCTKR